MKTAETISTTTQHHQSDAPFFNKKAGDSTFFSDAGVSAQKKPFFDHNQPVDSGIQTIQTKLTLGKPGDKYEVEADAMADRVVEQISKPKTNSKEATPALQTQPEEEKDFVEDIVQEKPIFESEAQNEEAVQSKAEDVLAVSADNAPLESSTPDIASVDTDSNHLIPTIQAFTNGIDSPLLQPKCEDCEEEPVMEEAPKLQRKSAMLGADDPLNKRDEFNRGGSWEEDQADKVISFKRLPDIQRASFSTDETSMRNRIEEMARQELGKVEAKRNDGSGRRTGYERLLEYFHLAAPDQWPDEVIEYVKHGENQFPHWCGIFSVYAIKKAGIDLGVWQVGIGVSAFNTLEQTDSPQKGDIGYIHEPYRHHCIVIEVNGDTVKTIDGNSGTMSEVIEMERPRSKFTGFFTAFTGSQQYIQPKATDSSEQEADSSLEDKLSHSGGKGSPMDKSTKDQMESAFGADFDGVQIHTDGQAAGMNQSLNSQAFTHGSDIYFNEGKYDPGSTTGKRLLAHELTHTLQQGAAVQQKSNLTPTHKKIQGDWSLPDINIGVDAFRNKLGDYADDYMPAYAMLSVAIGYDLVRGKSVSRNRANIIKGVFSLINPWGSMLRKRLEERNIINNAFDWIKEQLNDLNLTYDNVRRKFNEFWEEKSITRGLSHNINLLKRKFRPFIDGITTFVKRVANKVFEMIKEAFLKVLAALAKKMGGYDLLCDLLGFDPITKEKREATTANILRGILKLPVIQALGGDKLLAKLEELKLIDKTAAFIDGQWALLKLAFLNLKNVVTKFLNGFTWETLKDPMKFVNSIKDDVLGFVTSALAFFKNIAVVAFELIKQAMIWLLKQFVGEKTYGYDLVKVILAKDPLTGEAYPRTAENIICAFLKLLPNGEALCTKLKETGAVQKATQWIMGAIEEFVQVLTAMVQAFINLWHTTSIEDLFQPLEFFNKIVKLFTDPVAKLVAFVKRVVTKIIEILLVLMKFPVNLVKKIIANVQKAYHSIRKDPIGFLKRLLQAVKLGFTKFFNNIGTHLLKGLSAWLFGQVAKAGITPPKDLSLKSILELVMQILGITEEKLWAKLAEQIGQEKVDKIRGAISKLKGIWLFIKDVKENGIAAIWSYIKEKISNLWDMVLEQVRNWIITKIIERVTIKLLSMLDPTGIMAVVNSFIAFFKAVQSFIEYLRELLEIVNSFLEGVVEIASGKITRAAEFLESSLAKALPVAIGFLANQVGLGDIGDKLKELVGKVQGLVDRALTWLVGKAVKGIKSIIGIFTGKGKKEGKDKSKELPYDDPKKAAQVAAGLADIPKEEKRFVSEGFLSKDEAEQVASSIKKNHKVFTKFQVIDGGESWDYSFAASEDQKYNKEDGARHPKPGRPIEKLSTVISYGEKSANANPITHDAEKKGNKNTTDNIIGWEHAKKLNIAAGPDKYGVKGRKGNWVKGHKVHHDLGGNGLKPENLFIVDRSTNGLMKTRAESHAVPLLKQLLKLENTKDPDFNKVMFYNVTFDLHESTPPLSGFAFNIDINWGTINPDGSDPVEKDSFSTQSGRPSESVDNIETDIRSLGAGNLHTMTKDKGIIYNYARYVSFVIKEKIPTTVASLETEILNKANLDEFNSKFQAPIISHTRVDQQTPKLIALVDTNFMIKP